MGSIALVTSLMLALGGIPSATKVGPQEQVRERASTRGHASFKPMAQPIELRQIVLFQAFAEKKGEKRERWRCVAMRDYAECLGKELIIPFERGDERIVLRVSPLDVLAPPGQKLAAEKGGIPRMVKPAQEPVLAMHAR